MEETAPACACVGEAGGCGGEAGVAVSCSELQIHEQVHSEEEKAPVCFSVLQCVTVYCSVL